MTAPRAGRGWTAHDRRCGPSVTASHQRKALIYVEHETNGMDAPHHSAGEVGREVGGQVSGVALLEEFLQAFAGEHIAGAGVVDQDLPRL